MICCIYLFVCLFIWIQSLLRLNQQDSPLNSWIGMEIVMKWKKKGSLWRASKIITWAIMDISDLLINKGLCPPHSHCLLLEQIGEVSTLWGNVYRLRSYKSWPFFAKLCIKVFVCDKIYFLLWLLKWEQKEKGKGVEERRMLQAICNSWNLSSLFKWRAAFSIW